MIGSIFAFIAGCLQVWLLWLQNAKETRDDVKAQNQQVFDLAQQAFTGDIQNAASKMAAAIDRLGDIK